MQTMENTSAGIKYMPQGYEDFKNLLVTKCIITNFVVGIPLTKRDAEVNVEALIHRIICVFGPLNLFHSKLGCILYRVGY